MIDYKYIKAEFNRLKKKHTGYNFIGKLFKDVEQQYKQECITRGIEHSQQSWNAWSGKNLQKLITELVQEHISNSQFPVAQTSDDELKSKNLNEELDLVKRNITVFYSHYSLLPDADIIVYSKRKKDKCKIICVFSAKASLRERVAQSAYWKIKLTQAIGTKHILYYLISTDYDRDFDFKNGLPQRDRIIVEEGELDGAYIFRDVTESLRVKNFSKIFSNLEKLFSDWFKN